MRHWLSGALLVLAGCMTQPASQAGTNGEPVTDAAPVAFDSIRLTRTPCFGKCPVYSVTVHADGRVEYHGQRWVASEGDHTGRADPQALAALQALLQEQRLPLLADYRPGKPACGTPVTTDMPGASITIQQTGKTRTLHYYQGCPNAPQWLADLVTQIDKAAVSGRWVGGDQAPERLTAPLMK